MFEFEMLDTGGVRITKYTGSGLRVDVPCELERQPVVEIGDYAFSGREIISLSLPESVQRMGRYALYNCRALEILEFCNTLMDFGAGCFTGCHRIRRLIVHFQRDLFPGGPDAAKNHASEYRISPGEKSEFVFGIEGAREESRTDSIAALEAASLPRPAAGGKAGTEWSSENSTSGNRTSFREETSALREVLTEVTEELVVEYNYGEGKAVLVFPECFEEGVENTPARIIESHTHGSGMYYRNCFVDRRLRFDEYDRRFPYAIGQEREELLIRLAVERLRYPYGCSASAEEMYLKYLRQHFDTATALFVRTGEYAINSFLMNRVQVPSEIGKPDLDL